MHSWFRDAPFLTASAFSMMMFLDRWARGQGGRWLNYAEDFIVRKKAQGIVALRVFDETTFWADRDDNPDNDHKFFNDERATSLRMWNYRHIALPGDDIRPERLTTHHQVLLLKLFELAYKHDMRIELVVDATLKHSPGVGWKVIGHCIRQVADFCKNVEAGRWIEFEDPEGGGMGGNPSKDPDTAERIRKMFEAVAARAPRLRDMVAIETHNEWDAHSQGSWRDSWPELKGDALRAKAINEVDQQLKRMRKGEYWPGAATWVSHGGRDGWGEDAIEYDPALADAIAIHPSRHADPDRNFEVGGRFDPLIRRARELSTIVYANELTHGIGSSWWWTVEQGWFRPISSTKMHTRRRRFLGDLNAAGIVACDHTLENMACGYWYRGDEVVRMPLTEIEVMLVDENGGLEPPPPTRMRRYAALYQADFKRYVGHELNDPAEEDYRNEQFRKHYEDNDPSGWSQQDHQQVLIQSAEFRNKNPEVS